MASLSPKGRALIQAGRRALRPTAADRARIDAALTARLGPGAVPPALGLPHTTAWGWLPKAATAVCVVGGALFFAATPRAPTPSARPPVTRPADAVAVDAASSAAAALDETRIERLTPRAPAPATTARTPAPASRQRGDRLAQEVALLSRATSALRAGRADAALQALAAHQRLFPNGALREERHAAKAQALCSVGRSSEGRRELERLAPDSPAAGRARQVCESASSAADAR
jgi:hypothetical protein